MKKTILMNNRGLEMKDNFIRDIDRLALLAQMDEILKHTKPPADFDKPEEKSVLKFYQEFYDKHCAEEHEKENVENEL